jgi:hypothetical protein
MAVLPVVAIPLVVTLSALRLFVSPSRTASEAVPLERNRTA